jgi:apolipoprotein N-acyltransferase
MAGIPAHPADLYRLHPFIVAGTQGIRRARFFGWVYLSMLIWNIGATWWIWNSTGPGAAGAILANSLLMCVPWLGFHWIRSRMGNAIRLLRPRAVLA